MEKEILDLNPDWVLTINSGTTPIAYVRNRTEISMKVIQSKESGMPLQIELFKAKSELLKKAEISILAEIYNKESIGDE